MSAISLGYIFPCIFIYKKTFIMKKHLNRKFFKKRLHKSYQWRNQPENIGRKLFSYRLKNIGIIFFFLSTKNILVGNFLFLLKSNGIKIFLVNDNSVIKRKLKYDLKNCNLVRKQE